MNWNMEERGREQFCLFNNFPGGSEENHKNLCNGSQSIGQDLNRWPSEHEASSQFDILRQCNISAHRNNNGVLVHRTATM